MNVVEIRRDAELHELKPAWEALLRDSASDTIFLSWEWATAWWSSYGQPGELRLLTVFDDNGELRGIAPLRCQSVRKYGQTVSALSFVGDGSNDSDYMDFIVASGYEKPVMEAFFAHWRKELDRGTVLLFNEIPESSPNLAVLKTLAEPSVLWKETAVPCGAVRLPQSWEDYLSMLRPRFRTKIRSVLRNLESRPEVQFGFCKDPEQIQRMLPVLFDLHARRWAQDGKPGVFGWDRKRDFYLALSSQLIERGWLRLSWLEWNGRVLACQYGFAYRDTYFHLQEGYEPASEHWNVGLGLRAWSVREFLKEGIREYDFLGGVGRHKTDWGSEVKQSNQILLASARYNNFLFRVGPEWEARARESVKKMLPEKILAARHARLEQASAASGESGNGHSSDSFGSGWMLNAAAHCYFHFRLPVLARPLRKQHQLSVSRRGRWPRISWNRRSEPAARILYYHRVNDERDPFFPAISTKLFEQEMQFVARHYQVVCLGELLERLEGGSPEPVVAITFDDGYQDNYHNAFPILQRYGLPATIFLATGTMDSSEPLWFEQLAQALKTTAREFVDLEIDLPRRFWTRTPEERLKSNGQIFASLRRLPESQRRQWLAQILRQLAAPDDSGRRGKMLTWQQIRLMKEHGIHFGGHTVSHPFLSRLTEEQGMWEVSECKRRIEEEIQAAVDYFAYPNGREEDFTDWNKAVLRNAGYRAALTTIWGMNYQSTDRMELRRGQPWEESPELFACKLDWYQLVNG
jgi:peptidoglycan/xylan/chitin deacetylase (PgdA/CDA1 family)/CelD/BcsL family acetyltransferase involved in cellulose biosynthesis